MRITLFGGSGRTGQLINCLAATRGWQVTNLVRRPGCLPQLEGIREIVGSLEEDKDLYKALEGSDAIVITFGARPPYTDIFCASATGSIIRCAQESGIRRLIVVTGALVGTYPKNQGFVFRSMAKLFGRKAAASMKDREEQEHIVRNSDMDWTILKPPRLTNGSLNGSLVCGPDLHTGLFSKISRSLLAAAILEQCVYHKDIGKTCFIKQIQRYAKVS